jgi:hypothetical protein
MHVAATVSRVFSIPTDPIVIDPVSVDRHAGLPRLAILAGVDDFISF